MKSILLIEDNPVMLTSIEFHLRKDGYNVSTARDGREAFEMINNNIYDLVIIDLLLPYFNGLDVVSGIKNRVPAVNTGIIVISTTGNEEMINEAFSLGADDFIQKPIHPNELLPRVKKMLADSYKHVEL